jgi:hypothetical protein
VSIIDPSSDPPESFKDSGSSFSLFYVPINSTRRHNILWEFLFSWHTFLLVSAFFVQKKNPANAGLVGQWLLGHHLDACEGGFFFEVLHETLRVLSSLLELEDRESDRLAVR